MATFCSPPEQVSGQVDGCASASPQLFCSGVSFSQSYDPRPIRRTNLNSLRQHNSLSLECFRTVLPFAYVMGQD